jgi:hypothetical protein
MWVRRTGCTQSRSPILLARQGGSIPSNLTPGNRASFAFFGACWAPITFASLPRPSGLNTMRLPVKYGFPIYGHAHVVDGSTHPPASDQKTREWRTPMTTVDSWADQEGIGRISFVKVDVEGFEPSVIAGATRTIENHRPSLLLEIEDRHLGRYGTDGNTFADEIRTRWPDYRMYTWASETWTPAPRVYLGVRNYLFATDAAFTRG